MILKNGYPVATPEGEATVRVNDAAPDMLAALKALFALKCTGPNWQNECDEAWALARAAVAKAEGRS